MVFWQKKEMKSHSGVKSQFNRTFIKTDKISKESGRHFTVLFEYRHKGDYDDLFNFQEKDVRPLIKPTKEFIAAIRNILGKDRISWD